MRVGVSNIRAAVFLVNDSPRTSFILPRGKGVPPEIADDHREQEPVPKGGCLLEDNTPADDHDFVTPGWPA